MKGFNVSIQKCSSCSSLIDDRRISAGGLVLSEWTDGKSNNSAVNVGIYSGCFLVKCPYCLTNVWFNALEIHSSESLLLGVPDDFDKSRPFSKPKFQDYVAELTAGRVSPEQENEFRYVMWWVGNDRRRDVRKKHKMFDDEISNLQTLSGMLDISKESDRLCKAEIKRELGLFDEAYDLLLEPFDNVYTDTHRVFIKDRVIKKDCTVRAYGYK